MTDPAATAPVRRTTTAARVLSVGGGRASEVPDRLATEEPLEIRAGGPGQDVAPVAVTMRTPGHDFELAVGFLFTEGLIRPEDVTAVRYCRLGPDEEQQYNVVTVNLSRPLDLAAASRRFGATSSCGICGKASLDDVERHCPPVGAGPEIDLDVLLSLPARLREGQKLFDKTGGLHAAGLFSPAGEPLAVREDVGRHNATDKVVGHAVLGGLGGLPLDGRVLAVSGRIGFEIVQKAAMAGIPVVAAVSAPSSLAVDAAARFGITAVGFIRDGRANIYTHPERVRLP